MLVSHPSYSKRRRLTKNRKHLKTHEKPLKCHMCPNLEGYAEEKDRTRHYWSHHREWAKANHIKKVPEAECSCGYQGRYDNVKRHKETQGHD
jgi:hypothetical protein